jgi:hypothetical protein
MTSMRLKTKASGMLNCVVRNVQISSFNNSKNRGATWANYL